MDNRKVLDDFEKHWGIYRASSRPPLKLIWKKRGASSTSDSVFKLAWKSAQAFARELGFTECNSPKACLKQAFSQHWLNDEVLWLEMLSDRNRMVQTCNAADAMKVYESLNKYVPVFDDLLESLKAESGKWA